MTPRKRFILKNRMLLANLVSNLIGAVGVNALLLRSTRTLSTEFGQAYATLIEIIFTPTVFIIAFVATLIYEGPIRRYVDQCYHGQADAGVPRQVQRRVLNEPFFGVLLNCTVWLFAAVFWALLFYFMGEPAHVVQRTLVRSLSVGLITCTVAFFVLEHVLQRVMVPFFFPHGRLYGVPRTLHVSIAVRLVALLLACNLVPFVTLILYNFQIRSAGEDPAVSLDRLGTFLVVNSFVFIAVGLWLCFLVSSNLARPLKDMIQILQKVREGDFDGRVRVTSNDEIGYTGDVINQMTAGLKERDRLRLSMLLAREVQQNLLPPGPPDLSGIDLAAASLYCDETGGDYYDFLEINNGGGIQPVVVVGDVSGHGVSAALLMASARASLRQRVLLAGGLDAIVADVNRQLYRDVAASGQFMTLLAMRFDPDHDGIEWVRAGHDPAVLYDPVDDRFDELDGAGLPLGVDAGAHYTTEQRSGLANGTIVLLGTDGIWETFNPHGEMFGKARLRAMVKTNAASAASVIRDRIMAELKAFREGTPLEDDVTLVVAKMDRRRQ
ncbi:MAG: SpoIIE family protein phosphatase [Desulfobacterales bacterium]|nr:SpoIIE family protein phosphatase [Desulfobacterales bacterium]MDJ0856228.1 SpoIIE family protein phosphatase [Desulfobacterales bacterium]MDJ0886621.1 SpoIIE family protein phosphatase [Desulfobacterales bacterium]